MYAYHIAPIDTGWDLLPTVEEFAAKLATKDAYSAIHGSTSEFRSCSTFLNDFEEAKKLASQVGWEGDYKRYAVPRVLMIPANGTFLTGFVWKQDNNGATFIVVEEQLTHLNRLT